MVDRSDLDDVQVEQRLGVSTASAGPGEKDLDSSIPGLDSRAGYADFNVHLPMVPVQKLFQTPESLRFFIFPAGIQCTSCDH